LRSARTEQTQAHPSDLRSAGHESRSTTRHRASSLGLDRAAFAVYSLLGRAAPPKPPQILSNSTSPQDSEKLIGKNLSDKSLDCPLTGAETADLMIHRSTSSGGSRNHGGQS